MKQLKMLGVAAVAAMALMAMAGAGTASAAELCSTNSGPPCTGTKYGVGTTINAQLKVLTNAAVTNTISSVICKKSALDVNVTNAGGSGKAVEGTAPTNTGLTFSECETWSGTKCTVTVVNLPYTVTLTGSKGNGTVTVNPDGSGNPGAYVQCGVLINCTFTTASATLSFTGGNPAIIKANVIALERSGGFCPSEAHWDAEYEVTSQKQLFVI